MRSGEVDEGKLVLRAKIDMESPNMNLRDPTLYRVRQVAHQMTGDVWKVR
jgi:glutaminyl-tRNA synthetase